MSDQETKEVEDKQGFCPECGAELKYDSVALIKDGTSDGFKCCCSECVWTGIEWYALSFDCYTKTN